MALGLHILYDGEALSERIAEHDPRLEPRLGIWCTRLDRLEHHDEPLLRVLNEMREQSVFRYVQVMLAPSAQAVSRMCERSRIDPERGWKPEATVIVCPGLPETSHVSGDLLHIRVDNAALTKPMTDAERASVITAWMSFIVELCSVPDDGQMWSEWLQQIAPLDHAGQSQRRATVYGVMAKASFKPQAIVQRLARTLATKVSEELLAEATHSGYASGIGDNLDDPDLAKLDTSFASEMAKSLQSVIVGDSVTAFDRQTATVRLQHQRTLLAEKVSARARDGMIRLADRQHSWRDRLVAAVDESLRLGQISALAPLKKSIQQVLDKQAPVGPIRRDKGKTEWLPDLAPLASAHQAWLEVQGGHEPAAAALVAYAAVAALGLGLTCTASLVALGKILTPITSSGRPAVPPTWLKHPMALGMVAGAIITTAVWVWMAWHQQRRAQSARANAEARWNEAVRDWTEALEQRLRDAAQALVTGQVERHLAFRQHTLSRELQRVDAVLQALSRNAAQFAARGDESDTMLPESFYVEAGQLGRSDELMAQLRNQLGTPRWRYRLDLMDAKRVLERCESQFQDLRGGLTSDRHANLKTFMERTAVSLARELENKVAVFVRVGAATWLQAMPVTESAHLQASAGSAKVIRTREAVFVGCIWHDQGVWS